MIVDINEFSIAWRAQSISTVLTILATGPGGQPTSLSFFSPNLVGPIQLYGADTPEPGVDSSNPIIVRAMLMNEGASEDVSSELPGVIHRASRILTAFQGKNFGYLWDVHRTVAAALKYRKASIIMEANAILSLGKFAHTSAQFVDTADAAYDSPGTQLWREGGPGIASSDFPLVRWDPTVNVTAGRSAGRGDNMQRMQASFGVIETKVRDLIHPLDGLLTDISAATGWHRS